MCDRTRKKTNASDITDEEWNVVKERLAPGREQLRPVQVKGEKKNEIEESIESYVVQCENAMKTGI